MSEKSSVITDPSSSARRALAAMAWLVAAFGFLRAATAWVGDANAPAAVFFLGVGSGAGYLALALPRRIVSAWRACRDLASAIGTIHMVVLPSVAVAWVIAIAYCLAGGDVSAAERTQALCAAGAATALPWSFYHALGDPRVRSWFCVADYQGASS